MTLWNLGQALSLSGLLALGSSGPLALLPAYTGVLVGPGDAGPTRGLELAWMEAHSWRQGPTLGHVPPWASASGTP